MPECMYFPGYQIIPQLIGCNAAYCIVERRAMVTPIFLQTTTLLGAGRS